MKQFSIFILTILAFGTLQAQDFSKDLASARTAYSSGDLENARFAMQQMLNDLDVLIGKEIMKLLPAKMDALAANTKNDNVTVNTGLTGVLIHRDYGTGDKAVNIEIMSNSPLIASINAILSIPFIGNSGDGTQKVVKIDGYKSVLQKEVDSETNKTGYTLQTPLNSTLVTIKIENTTEADIVRLANTIPLSQIAKMVQ
jgi:hypothetical protein